MRGRAESDAGFARARAGCTLALGAALLLLAGCTLGTSVQDACDSETGACSPCAGDADCRLSYECCGPSFICSHRDDTVIVCQLGCADPIGPEPDCLCVDGRCRGE